MGSLLKNHQTPADTSVIMCTEIGDVLQKRSDLSGFIVHLTKGETPEANIKAMLLEGRIRSEHAFGYLPSVLEQIGVKSVCFTEAPIEHLPLMTAAIKGRNVNFSPWGLAFPKHAARRLGANPVIYFHKGASGSSLAKSLNKLFDDVHDPGQRGSAMKNLMAMVSVMKHEGGQVAEWWWEREWRHVGHFRFKDDDLAFGLCPREQVEKMEAWAGKKGVGPKGGLRFLAPDWTMEERISHLVGSAEDPHPWPHARYGA